MISLLQSFIKRVKNCQQQSCSAINCLSTDINILAGGRSFPSEILAPSDLPPAEGSEFWHILPCSASTVRPRKKVQLQLTRTRHGLSNEPSTKVLPAPNFLKMGINYPNLSSLRQISTIKDEKSTPKFHYIKTLSGTAVVQSIAFRVVSIYWQGVAPFPWYLNSERKWTDPHWKALQSKRPIVKTSCRRNVPKS